MLFLSSLIHYLWVFGITIVLILIACFAGIKWRKIKDSQIANEDIKGNEVKEERKQ